MLNGQIFRKEEADMMTNYEKTVFICFVDGEGDHVTAHNSTKGCGGGSMCQKPQEDDL